MTSNFSRIAFAAVGLLSAWTVCAAQNPGTSESNMARAAGMPLQVGDLPPGTLAVRLVRDAFVENIAGVPVQVEIQGAPAKQGLTKDDGRATFAHLPIGARVRAVADVGGQRLESETFEMPRDGGVRVLLVVDGSTSPGPARQSPTSQIPLRDPTPVVKGLVVGAMAVIGCMVFVLGRRFGAAGRPGPRNRDPHDPRNPR